MHSDETGNRLSSKVDVTVVTDQPLKQSKIYTSTTFIHTSSTSLNPWKKENTTNKTITNTQVVMLQAAHLTAFTRECLNANLCSRSSEAEEY